MNLKGQILRILKVFMPALLAFAIGLAAISQPVAAESEDRWDKLSTAFVLGLAGGAELQTLTQRDKAGQWEFFKTMAATLALSQGLKAVIHKQRPDGSSNDSFPSAHTALAFAAASYFDIRFGQKNQNVAPLLYSAAALTAFGRIKAKKHYFVDVAAGALLGAAMGHAFTSPNSGLNIYPTGDGAGINFATKF